MIEQLKNCQLLQMDELFAFSLLSIRITEKIHNCEESPLSCIVKVSNGRTYRQNRKHLRQTNKAPPNTSIMEQGGEDELAIPTKVTTYVTNVSFKA